MNRLLSLAASAMLLALVVTSGALPGSLPYVPMRPTVRSPHDYTEAVNRAVPSTTGTTGASPDTLLIELHPKLLPGEPTFDQPSDAIVIPRMFAALGVRSAEPVFPRAAGAPDAQAATPGIAKLRRIYRLRLAPGADREWAAEALRVNPLVVFAEPDYEARIVATPTDPRYAEQWALAKINAPAGWDATTGSGNVVIAVIDSGVDTTHADLAGQLWTNPGEIPANGIDDDNDGHIDDVNGWNFLGDNADLSDTTGHGTQVAGVIAASANNNAGGAGLCWNCKLMIVKVTQSGGIANYSDIAAGVLYAAQKGAKVINLSLGGTSDSATLRAAIAAAAQTAVIVGGAGNNNSSALFYPAAYDDSVLAVAGATQADTKVATSNYGAWVDVSAPGENILTTFSGGGYGAASGTSVAAPFAAGLAGLLLSQHPDWSPAQVRSQIVNTATSIDSLNPGLSGQLGSGRINAAQAMTTPATPALALAGYAVNGHPGGRPEPGSAVDLLVTLTNRWGNATNVQATLSGGGVTIVQPTGSFGAITALKTGTNATAFRFNAASGYNTPMNFILSVTADGGYTANLPLTITSSPGITNVTATITTQSWTADRVYVINQDSGVPAGATLTIQPGTVVRFAPNTSLSIAGTLIADGTEAQPIRFTRQGTAGTWGQIKFADSSVDANFDGSGSYTGGSILRHSTVEYGQGIDLTSAAPYMVSSAFSNIANRQTFYFGMAPVAINGSPSGNLVIADNRFIDAGIAIQGFQATGGATISGNIVAYAPLQTISEQTMPAIVASGAMTVTNNRIIGSGITIDNPRNALISGNLIANGNENGLVIKMGVSPNPMTTLVVGNTIMGHAGAEIYADLSYVVQGGSSYDSLVLHANNLIARNSGSALHLADSYSQNIDATGNWWGTTDPTAIQKVVYDSGSKFGLGTVDFSSPLSEPDQTAPAYVQHITVSPDTTLGIQPGTFEVQFSRPMDQSANPLATFAQTKRGTWAPYTLPDPRGNDSIGPNNVSGIAVDRDGAKWFATNFGVVRFDGRTWTTDSTMMSGSRPDGIPPGGLAAIVIDHHGHKWVGGGSALARLDGSNWITFPFPHGDNPNWPSGRIISLAVDLDDSIWFTTGPGGGIGRFDGSNWRFYRNSDAGFTINESTMLTIDHNGVKWFATAGTSGGVGRFDGATWTLYTPTNSGLPDTYANGIAIDTDGSAWFSSGSALARFDGSTWTTYRNPTNASGNNAAGLGGLAIDKHGVKWVILSTTNIVSTMRGVVVSFDGTSWKSYPPSAPNTLLTNTNASVTIDADGNKWFRSLWDSETIVLWGGDDYALVNNAQWIDDHTWRASYDITSLVARGAQTISVSGARGADGMEIAPDSRFGFTVDYAGTISDRTPPNPPRIFATGTPGDPSSVRVIWSASDGESGIVAYRYAIGTAPGATDVVNWTTVGMGQAVRVAAVTSSAGAGVTRASLGLADGKQYWVSVQAQNSGGLWSASQYGSFVAGQQSFISLYLPLSKR